MNKLLKVNDICYLLSMTYGCIQMYELLRMKVVFKLYVQGEIIDVYGDQLYVLKGSCVTNYVLKLEPLRLVQSCQHFLDWSASGLLVMKQYLILYDDHSVVFYSRQITLQKSWRIEIMQSILEIKNSYEQDYIGMQISGSKSQIFLWNLQQVAKKPHQEINVNAIINDWGFHQPNILVILTQQQLSIYLASTASLFCLYYFIPMKSSNYFWIQPQQYKFNSKKLCLGNTHRSVHNIGVLDNNEYLGFYQLYDLQKRTVHCEHHQLVSFPVDNIKKIIGTWEYNKNLMIMAETDLKPKIITLNHKLKNISSPSNKPLLPSTTNQVLYHHPYAIIHTKSVWNIYSYQSQLKFIRTLQCDWVLVSSVGWLLCFSEKSLQILKINDHYYKSEEVSFKYSNKPYIIYEQNDCLYLVCGIKGIRVTIEDNKPIIKPAGIILRNQRSQLMHVHYHTHSALYKLNQDYLLIACTLKDQKLNPTTIKTSKFPLLALKSGRWCQLNSRTIVLGHGTSILTIFELNKLYAMLQQQNTFYEYRLDWLTHHGLALTIKNWIFFLQLVHDQMGYELVLLKKGKSLLYRRFANIQPYPKLLDGRKLIIWSGCKLFKLQSRIGNLVTQNPFELPDTLLHRQLQTRQYLPPHHPQIIMCLIQQGKFQLILKIVGILTSWMKQSQVQLIKLYHLLTPELYRKQLEMLQENIDIIPQHNLSSQIEIIQNLCEEILNAPENTLLAQNGALTLEAQLQAIIFSLENSRAVDIYSRVILTQIRTPQFKNKPFQSHHIAFMMHSINKEEAVGFLQTEKIDWAWLKKYSILLWYENLQQTKKWVEQVAAGQFRTRKDPFDCLFWYILIDRKALLANLFKSQQFSSKEHDAMHKFLGRDFSQPKDKAAAIKNAYVLIDKKRYLQALSFFILGDKIHDCINFCLERLKDINLAYLICLMRKEPIHQILYVLQQGDIWTKHIAFTLQAKYVNSYNTLFQETTINKWEYSPALTGFQPAVIEFAKLIRNSIPIKRQLELQNTVNQQKDIFNQFYSEGLTVSNVNSQTNIIKLISDFELHNKMSVEYYLRHSCPFLAAVISPNQREVQRACDLEKFKLAGQVCQSMLEIIIDLEDISNIVKNYYQNQQSDKLVDCIKRYRIKLEICIKDLPISQVYDLKRHKIGQLMHYCYHAQRIILYLSSHQHTNVLDQELLLLKMECSMGRIFLNLTMECYQQLHLHISYLQNVFKKKQYTPCSNKFWADIKQKYDTFAEYRNQKPPKLMDSFEYAFCKHFIPKQRVDPHSHISNPKLNIEHALPAMINFEVIRYLCNMAGEWMSHNLHQLQVEVKLELQKWNQKSILQNLSQELRILTIDGLQARLKLKYLNFLNNDQLDSLVTLLNRIDFKFSLRTQINSKSLNSNKDDTSDQFLIEIFRNKQEKLRCFTLNMHQNDRFEGFLLYKKNLAKFDIYQNLMNRNRSQDGFSLLHDEIPNDIEKNQTKLSISSIFSGKYHQTIQQGLQGLLNSRQMYESSGIIRHSSMYNANDFMKSLESIPYMQEADLNCLECHHQFPLLLAGYKSAIEVCNFNTLKNFNRIKCPNLLEIDKIVSFQHRITAMDRSGSLNILNLDSKYTANCVFTLRKIQATSFCHLTASQIAVIAGNSLQVYDTLVHPKKQSVFRIQFSNPPNMVCAIGRNRIAALRKTQLLIYDIRSDRLENSFQLEGRGKVMVSGYDNKVSVGRYDAKVRVIDAIDNTSQTYKISQIGKQLEDKDKISIDCMVQFNQSVLCSASNGSIYIIPSL